MHVFPFRPNYRELFVGLEAFVPQAKGESAPAINFDNAATTPPFNKVMHEINQFAPFYSSIHRGTGYKSILSSQVYENARKVVLSFVGGLSDQNTVIFVKNTTEAINKLAYRLWNPRKKEVVLTTWMEHHSNLLPWRNKFQVDYVELNEQGGLNLEDLERKLQHYQGTVKLVTVSGASNVTGIMNPIHHIAEIAHRYQAKILVDAAQLAPHAAIDMRPNSSPEHIDFLAFSAHKMYAPFGIGALIGPMQVFEQGNPEHSGGGTVQFVTKDRVIWDDPPHKEEAGTPNILGIVALVAAIETLNKIGMKTVFKQEERLLHYTQKKLEKMPGIKLYTSLTASPRIGVIPFNIVGMHHEQVAQALSWKGRIAVRNGCFCAQPYVQKLLRISDREMEKVINNPLLPRPGIVRVSFGLYNTIEEVDQMLAVLQEIAGSDRTRMKFLSISEKQVYTSKTFSYYNNN
ncbi:aminotransferase class V-fold PLP-dependent enzyme [Desulfitobacterium metallireducens]|uniref:Class V aminotransferase n=1 Tax=Desulfitobacterium metallireducens DSM 15288 TaxID=871968 RepID=W0E8V4_9FIRM|nr:aminotransferase class V-fold PLP-dependent enzyme [Desulfitobacterium metallireducens]AHF05963.1 class V aminotransferase [Desulfitobacterium metallireducens DSM 15288]